MHVLLILARCPVRRRDDLVLVLTVQNAVKVRTSPTEIGTPAYTVA